MSTIHTDVASDDLSAGIDATEAFSKLWGMDASEPSEPSDEDKKKKPADEQDDELNDDGAEGDDEASEETPEDDEEAEGDDNENEEGEGGKQATIEIKDDHKFKIPVDGVEQEFTLGSLKRLAGQEASLTRKGQEVAATRKKVDDANAAYLARSAVLLERAKAKYEPFKNLDLLAWSKDPSISQEQLVAMRDAAKAAHDELSFLEQDTAQLSEALRQQSHQELMQQAQESIKVLKDPEKGIEGFTQELYGDICKFAADSGLPQDIVNSLVNPAAIKLINMARLYAKGQTKVQTAKSDKQKAPKRIVKGTATAEATKKITTTAKATEPMKRLRKSGSVEDASEAFLARWSRSDDE